MFWKFNLLNSHVDTLLDKEDVTLLELLDEDDVLQECKGQNRKLIDFLVRPENIEELVNMVIQEPSDETDEKSRYKYPNLACELLTSDVGVINDKMAGEGGLMTKLYSFLESEGPLNPLLASFFSKVMGQLITRKSEFMVEFLKTRSDFVGQLLHHLGTSAIMDLVLRLVTCIESPECRMECIRWLDEEKLVQKLVGLIDPAHDEDKHCNASQALCDIIRLSREQMSQLQEKADRDPLLASIESQETITDLLGHMFDLEKNESVIVNGLTVIQTLLEFRKIGVDGMSLPFSIEGMTEQLTPLDAERLAHGVKNTLTSLNPRLKDVHNILLEPPCQHYSEMRTTVGVLSPPLGNARLQIARLVSSLLLTNTHAINAELASLGTMNVMLDLYFKYIWNNFLHTQVEICIATILSMEATEVDGKYEHPLLNQLITQCKLLERILESWEDNELNQSRPGGHRKGYMGHLTRIANCITDLASKEKGNNVEMLKELIQELPEEKKTKWDSFISGTLADMNKQNTVELVGGHPLHSSSEDDDADFRDIPFPQDTAMQQLQQMTSNFIDQFGFNDEEFAEQEERIDNPFNEKISSINFEMNATEDNPSAASNFEQACSDRMQQFDEADSDEEWESKEITFAQGSKEVDFQGGLFSSGQSSDTRPGAGVQVPVTSSSGNDQDSDESTDSEEDLDSPTKIYQSSAADASSTPRPAEKMDVDSSDNWANFDEMAVESTPVAMDTGSASVWDTPTSGQTASQNDNWANFDNAVTSNQNTGSGDTWADFTSFTPMDSANLNVSEHNPRSSSPVAMETADSTSGRSAAYVVSSGPADQAVKLESAVPDSTTGAAIVEDVCTSSQSSIDEVAVDSTTSTAKSETNNTHQDHFLSSSGLLKSSNQESPAGNESKLPDSAEGDAATASADEQAKVEEIRAKAKEAMDNFSQSAGSGSSSSAKPSTVTNTNTSQNGPV